MNLPTLKIVSPYGDVLLFLPIPLLLLSESYRGRAIGWPLPGVGYRLDIEGGPAGNFSMDFDVPELNQFRE